MIKEIPIEKIFLFISLIFGLLYVFILPPFQSVDEAAHFYRSYEIIANKPIAQKINGEVGDYLPSSLQTLVSKYDFLIQRIDEKVSVKYILNSAGIKLNPDEVKFIGFPNTALYSPTCYLTQTPGMYIAKAFNASPLIIFYLGRLSNLLFFTLIIYFAIKIIPFYKLTMMLLALMPMTLSLAGALTSDVVVIGLNFLWIAILLKLIVGKEKVNNLQICFLILLALIIVLSKDYFMLIPLIFLLPKSKFQNLSKYLACIIGVLLVSIIGLFLWQKVINGLNIDLNVNADALKQLNFIIHNPLAYLLVILKTLFVKTPRIIITMIGVLGMQDTRLDFMTYLLYPILIILSIISENKTDFEFKKWQLYLISFDIIISICLIFTSLYLMWSEVASPIIYGLNGKYFTPIMLPFLLLFYGHKKIEPSENIKLLVCLAVILILVSSDLSLIHRFYNLTPNLHYKV